jgi:hypothetical protein
MKAKKTAARKRSRKGNFFTSPLGKKIVILLMAVVALGVLVVIINGFPLKNQGSKYGVGADGYSVYEVKGADLGIAKVVDKSSVESAFGSLVKSVDDVDTSGVISLNGNKGQTATYYIQTKAGTQGSFYVDVMEYKSQKAYDADNIFADTADAGKVNGLAARTMPAFTIANEREYALLVTKGLKSYKFALTQPYKNVTIDEVTAQTILKKIAAKANL